MKNTIKIGWIFTFVNEWYKIIEVKTTVNEKGKTELVKVVNKTETISTFEKNVIQAIINSKSSKYYDSKGIENLRTERNMDGSGEKKA